MTCFIMITEHNTMNSEHIKPTNKKYRGKKRKETEKERLLII